MKQAIIRVTNGVPRHPQYRMKEPVNFSLLRGEQLAIVGRNGAGKSLLAECSSVPERVLTPEKEAILLQLPYADGASAPVVPMAGPSVPADLNEGHSTEATATGTSWTEETVIEMRHVSIRYDERTILKDLNWRVCRGERWALQGANGSGKSTLLSLACADNPQSYACNLALFGRQRGSGESIWEIKRRIGYVSPEMHRAYRKALPAIDVVASGLHDSVGLYLHPRPEQRAICETWLDLFGVAALKDRNFLQLSSGEQRLVLLARAFVKDPELLILDEPLHGLDSYHRRLVKDIIEAFCQRKGKTLVMVTHYAEELPACITHSLRLQRN